MLSLLIFISHIILFQTVRDLLSPNAEEQHYKNGMRKDPDGFMDIEWCCSTIINSW